MCADQRVPAASDHGLPPHGEVAARLATLASAGRGALADLTVALCDIASVSGEEAPIADAVEAAVRLLVADSNAQDSTQIVRRANNVVIRTDQHRPRRVVLAGHLDTVPVAGNLPARRTEIDGRDAVWGRGAVDMKGGDAVFLALLAPALRAAAGQWDITWVFYEAEEVEAARNGLGHLVRDVPDLVTGDLAILGEPSSAGIEGGCNGTLRVNVIVPGVAAHSARSWVGKNAIHAAAPVLDRLANYQPRTVNVDGLDYREGLNAVRITGGVAGNVIPDRCVVTVNYRFAPSRSVDDALAHVRDVFAGFEVAVEDAAAGARPGLDRPEVASFVSAVLSTAGGEPRPKYGWTDVARFAELGIPAVNFGPGDALLAHTDGEWVAVEELESCFDALASWLTVPQ